MTGRGPSTLRAMLEARNRFFWAVAFDVVDDPNLEDANDELLER
jgi:hypothetical protein